MPLFNPVCTIDFVPPQGGITGSVDILKVEAPNLVAPAGVWFEATNLTGFNVPGGPGPGESYDPSAHEITYIWTIRNSPLNPYTSHTNMVTGWNRANVAYGKKVSFAFPDEGTYTIDLWATDSAGTIGVSTRTVVVGNADGVYSGNLTICFSNDPGETWVGEKAGCQRVTSEAALQGAINALSPAVPRILFKRGQVATNIDLFLDVGQLGYVGAWGTGDRPIVQQTGDDHSIHFWDGAAMSQFTLTDIDFRGRWDSPTETGRPTIAPFNFLGKNTDMHALVWNCAFDGFNDLSLSVNADVASTVIFANNVITNWRDYGIFVDSSNNPASRMAIFGCRIAQHVDALSGGDKNGLFNTHGPIRYAGTYNVYIAVCDLFSRCGWSGLGFDTAEQPCLRVNSLGFADRYLNVDRVVMEGGWRPISASGQNGGPSGTVENPGNYVFDKLLSVTSAKSISPFIVANFGGTTVRNTIGIMPNVPQYHDGNGWIGAIMWEPDNPGPANAAAPMSVHSTSFISLRDQTNDLGHLWGLDDGSTAFSSITRDNNVLHGASLDTPVTSQGPIDLNTPIPGVSLRHKGVRYGFEAQNGNYASNVAPGQSFTIPYSEITEDLARQTGGAVTNQAYWQAIENIDTLHFLVTRNEFSGSRIATREDNELSVTFEATQVRITNTSTETWYTQYSLRLDRKSLLPAMQTQFANPATVPLPRPTAGSPALDAGDAGVRAYDDFMGVVRPGASEIMLDHTGAVRPATGNERGALLEA